MYSIHKNVYGDWMSTVSVRLDKETIRLLEEIGKDEKAERSEVIRKLLHSALQEWRVKRALQLLRQGKISVGKAAEFTGSTVSEILELAAEHDITVGYSLEDLERDLDLLKGGRFGHR